MWLTESERGALTVVGALLLVGLGLRWLQSQRPPLRVVEASAMPLPVSAWDARLQAARQVDVNTSDVAELERLPGVGPALAARIVADRSAHGPFASPEELTRVPGIGPTLYQALKDYVVTSGSTQQSAHSTQP
ncbi:MAG: helix-hairpin-helix domain-containing protein [Candidatus Omnitrophica bacterium]|nr:helix-hairpin-helix domain-containing protein [Candidatus Omnitrophota bacterium]